MPYEPLVPCPRCSRHIRHREAVCPFCRMRPPSLASAAAVVLASSMVVACSRSESTDVKQDPYKIKSTPTSEPTSKPVPTVPTKDAGLVDDPGAQADIYGAPPPPRTTDAGVAKDAK